MGLLLPLLKGLLLLLLPPPPRDMVSEFEAVSVAMSEPGADLDALTNKMGRLQVELLRRWASAEQ
jgi:hypothetical protein